LRFGFKLWNTLFVKHRLSRGLWGPGQEEVASGRGAGTGALKGGVMEGRSLDSRSLRRENAFTPPAVRTSLVICMVSRNSRAHSL
jgi:hypothetical protein